MFIKKMRTLKDVYASLDMLRYSMTLKDAIDIYAVCVEETKGLTPATITELNILNTFASEFRLMGLKNREQIMKVYKSFIGNEGNTDKAVALNNFFQWCGYSELASCNYEAL